ncbi:WD repeat-containing protein 52 [Tupaia chinensis]|uniref:WD repeat-containing protein 52 n=1 Tax=Tupaia chinensis TaxID=246437 RepID=L9KC00_TUPCH|nr:WD repeat-containing protein 52 [Tupaia chinensis]
MEPYGSLTLVFQISLRQLSVFSESQDPECLFAFHSGAVEALAISPITYLMATVALDCSIRIYDFAGKAPLVQMKFKQGGTALAWVPRLINYAGAQIIAGFEDGVVRILELYDPKGLTIFAGRKKILDAEIYLKQVFKPHTACVTALAYERDGEILATGVESTLLIICENGYILEAPLPTIKEDVDDRDVASYEIKDMCLQCFHFSSVKSKILRLLEIERREKQKELREKEKEERRKKLAEEMGGDGEKEFQGGEEEEEEEEPLPEIFIPPTPSPILCGFYSEPGKFWVSLGGYDSGFLYHCKFPPCDKDSDFKEQNDEPFDFRYLEDTDDNPIQTITFSTSKTMMFCGMRDGAIRVYVLSENDPSLTSLEDYWHFSVHDNNYGCVRNISTSFDDRFLVTTGADSNIFVFSIFSELMLKKGIKAKVPSPRLGIEAESIPEDIEDPKAYSIETARRKREYDKLMKEVEEIKAEKREQIKVLRNEFCKLLEMNKELPNHMQFKRTDFDLDSKIRAEIHRKTAYKIHQVEKELAWEKEKHELGLMKLQNRYKSRPADDYEDPKDVQAIKEAQVFMGDFNLKTAPDYKIPEHMRINAAKKKEELGHLDSLAHGKKMHMNKCILSLRDLKVAVIEEIQCLVQELRNIQSTLPKSKHTPIPQVPQIHPEEVPEKRFEYDEETLLTFKQRVIESENEKPPPMKQAVSGAIGGGFLKPSSGKDGDLLTRDSITRSSKASVHSLDSSRLMEFERAETTEVELEIMKRDEIKHLYMQEYLTKRWKINETLKEMEEKKNEIARLLDQEKALYAGFQAALGENNKFANFLTKVLKKKIKRVKKKEVEGDADEDEESEESSEEESSLEGDEDESGSEDEVFDDSICPINCDPSLFELVLQLREKRLDIEEALVEEKKIVDNLKKEYDTLSKKVKVVATNLNAAEEALEAYQREKQQRLNELLVAFPLKLHQIEYVVFGEVPTDLSGTLVFSNHSLGRLQERIIQLQEENSKQLKLNKECRERRKMLIREKREMAKTIQKMEETVRKLMISKFGRVIDLEALQTLSVNTTLEELKIKKLRKELSNAKEMKLWEEKIAQVRFELMMKTKEHTKKLHQMNDLCIEKKKLDTQLNTLQNQQGNAFQSLRRADIVAREKVTELIQEQAERILALKEEIALLRKKGGLILPPIQPSQDE